MALHPEFITIDARDQLEPVLEVMTAFAARGAGWINLQPEVAPEDAPPPRSALTQLFRRNSPDTALATWMSPGHDRVDTPQTLGVQHALGTRLVPLLGDWNLDLPPDWRRTQDSPRRGLLVEVPAGAPHDQVMGWLLDVTVVSTRAQTTGRWQVSVFTPRGG